MRTLLFCCFISAIFALAKPPQYNPTKLIFLDEFDQDANTPNQDVWHHEITLSGGGNWEFEAYVNNRSSSFLKGGALYLQPFLTEDLLPKGAVEGVPEPFTWALYPGCTDETDYGCSRTSNAQLRNYINPITSARINTKKTFAFRYGKVEIRARLPTGDWLWPAIWLLPKNQNYGDWPASGEIDIVESRGNGPDYPCDSGVNAVSSALHWGPFWPSRWPLTNGEYKKPSGTFGDEYHVFTLEWYKEYIRTSVDGNEIMYIDMSSESFFERGGYTSDVNNPWEGRPKNAPFDEDYYLIFNVAVGGTGGFFEDCPGKKPWINLSSTAMADFWDAKTQWINTWKLGDASHPSAMQVDWVKVWCDPADSRCAKQDPLIVE